MLTALFALMLVSDQAVVPSADEIVARMVQRDAERRSALAGYTNVRQYVLENTAHRKQASMVVRAVQREDGSKEFEIISSSGWSGARKHVFPKLLESESEASRPGTGDSRITPQNYSFSVLRVEEIDGRKAYVLAATPKQPEKYLMRGTIWVDAEDFAIVRIEGTPARNPSFWVKSVQFAHRYEKHGQFWLAASDKSVSDARIIGPTELRIDYVDYVLHEPAHEAKLR